MTGDSECLGYLTMSFIFSETLGSDENGGSRCTQDSECSGCQTCVRGFCTDTDAACSGNTPYCVNGTCQGCHAGEFQDTKGKCHACGGDNGLNMWTNLSVLNVKDNGFITPIISDVSRVQTMLIPGSMLLNSLPVWRAGTGHGRTGHAVSVPEPLVPMGQHVNNKKTLRRWRSVSCQS